MKRESRDRDTVAQLLHHLQKLRGSVPVNHRLKADLREQLLERMRELDTELDTEPKGVEAPSPVFSRQRIWSAFMVLFTVMIIGMLLYTSVGRGEWTGPTNTADAVLIRGMEATLAQVGETLQVLDSEGLATQSLLLPPEITKHKVQLQHLNPTADASLVTLSVDTSKGSQLWLISMRQKSSRLIAEWEGGRFGEASWAPTGQELLVTFHREASSQIYKLSLQEMTFTEWTKGEYAAWSPDGKLVTFVQEGSIWISQPGGEQPIELGEGLQPHWLDDRRIAFLQKESPGILFTVEAHRNDSGAVDRFAEVERTELPLQAEEAEAFYGLSFGPDGEQLLWVTREGSSTKLIPIALGN